MADDRSLPTLNDGGVICAFGELVLDLITVLDGPLPVGGQVHGKVETRPGGAARRVVLSLAGNRVPSRMIGRSGDGPALKTLMESLIKWDVDVRTFDVGRYTTSLCIQMVSGETTYVTDETAAEDMSADDVDESWFENASIVHITGDDIYRSNRFPLFERVVELTKKANAYLTIDTGTTSDLSQFGVGRFREALAAARPEVLFCSEHEGDILELDRVYPVGVGVVIQHRAVAPTKIFFPDDLRLQVPVGDTHRYTDSVGAGDTFAGGFLSAWALGATVVQATQSGHHEALHYLRGLMHPAGVSR